MKEKVGEANELDGFEEVGDEFQKKIETAWEEGKVADEDVPEGAKKDAGDDDEDGGKKKRKKAAPKKKVRFD